MVTRRAFITAAAVFASRPALAACAVDRLGTARTLSVGTQGGLFVGLKTYPRTLPLRAKEVILTFDDGPLPAVTNRVLAALDCEGTRATFFMIGRNAQANPALVQRIAALGHTVACHSFSHPVMRNLPHEAARADITRGFAAIDRAMDGKARCAPFFRYPGFADTQALNAWLASEDKGVFGTDLWASDWDKMNPAEELALVMSRLERAGKGMILFHDIQSRTAAMLPDFLAALRQGGWRIVHLVPGPGNGPTEPAPPSWHNETDRLIGLARRKAAT